MPEITTLSFKFVCPPNESILRFPEAVVIVLGAEPTETPFAAKVPVPMERTLVSGLTVILEPEETAIPEPFCVGLNSK